VAAIENLRCCKDCANRVVGLSGACEPPSVVRVYAAISVWEKSRCRLLGSGDGEGFRLRRLADRASALRVEGGQ
jgi:hypothetical protein